MNLPYRLELVPDTDEGGFVASYPELRGCLTSGETAEAALKNALDCKREWLAAANTEKSSQLSILNAKYNIIQAENAVYSSMAGYYSR